MASQRQINANSNIYHKLDYLENILNSCCLPDKRIDDFAKGMPTYYSKDEQYGCDYYDLKFSQNEGLISFNNKYVKKIRFMKVTAVNAACVYFNYLNGTKETRSIDPNQIATVENAMKLFSQKNEVFSENFNPGIIWKTMSMSTVYDACKPTWEQKLFNPNAKGAYGHYDELHAIIINNIISFMKQYPNKNLNIIDGGCGEGDLLSKFQNELGRQSVKNRVKLFGFDCNQDNINRCPGKTSGAHFVVGNLSNLDKILTDAKQKGVLNSDYQSILILSGSLTKRVLNNAFEAAQILQKARLLGVHYLIGGGANHPFINAFMLKRIGYGAFHKNVISADKHHFFDCYMLADEEIMKNKIKKIATRKFLDLTLSPCPEKWLKKLNEQKLIQNDLTIDISYCEITPEFLATIKELKNQFPQVNWIYWHWDSRNINMIIDTLGSSAKLRVKKTDNDSYLVSGRRFFDSLIEEQKQDHAEVKKIELNNFDVEYYVNTENFSDIESVAKNPDLIKQTQHMLTYAFKKNAFDIAVFIVSLCLEKTLADLCKLMASERRLINYRNSILHVAIENSDKFFKNKADKSQFFTEICSVIAQDEYFLSAYYLIKEVVDLAKSHYNDDVLLNFCKLDYRLGDVVRSSLDEYYLNNAPFDFRLKIYSALYTYKFAEIENGSTLLHKTAREHDEKNQYLEKINKTKKINFNIKDSEGNTICHILATKDECSGFKTLEACKLDYSAKNKLGQTPLHCAYQSNQIKPVEYLLQKSWKSFFIKDKSGKYPIEFADEKSNSNLCEQTKKSFLILLDQFKKSDLKTLTKNLNEMKLKFSKILISSPNLFKPGAVLPATNILNVLDALYEAAKKQIDTLNQQSNKRFSCF